jgi:hypothetical protein
MYTELWWGNLLGNVFFGNRRKLGQYYKEVFMAVSIQKFWLWGYKAT